jgi:hypothetical protein
MMAPARLFFIVSRDYGELSNALFVVKGRTLADRATLMVPPSMYATSREALPRRIWPYDTLQDLLDAIDAAGPDVVFLFSGYLYSINGLLSADEIARLLAFLRPRVRHVVTSDPFLGALFREDGSALLSRFHAPFRATHELLQDLIHFYPASCRGLLGGRAERSVSTFNPWFIRAGGLESVADPADPFWLFVISREDFELQCRTRGEARFVSALVDRLGDARRLGRWPVFVGPRAAVSALHATGRPDFTALSFCPYDLFVYLLQRAEHVFYWNILSNSAIIRFGSGLPAFFFHTGHLAQISLLSDAAVDNILLGWRPVCLDLEQPLTPPLLKLLEALYSRELEAVTAHVRSAPSPEAMLAEIFALGDAQADRDEPARDDRESASPRHSASPAPA